MTDTTREAVARATIAAILDHPTVYMGGPSKRSLQTADKILTALAALRPAQDAEGWVMVPVGHLKEAMRFYPPFDHDIKTRLIGNDLREIAAATAPRSGESHE